MWLVGRMNWFCIRLLMSVISRRLHETERGSGRIPEVSTQWWGSCLLCCHGYWERESWIICYNSVCLSRDTLHFRDRSVVFFHNHSTHFHLSPSSSFPSPLSFHLYSIISIFPFSIFFSFFTFSTSSFSSSVQTSSIIHKNSMIFDILQGSLDRWPVDLLVLLVQLEYHQITFMPLNGFMETLVSWSPPSPREFT